MQKLTNHYTLILVAVFMLLLSGNSCRKMPKSNDNPTQPPSRIPDYTTTVLSSISGFVNFEWGGSGNYLVGAMVQFGNKSTLTDRFGYFEIKDANVIKDAAQLIVTKDDYETGYKTFQVSESTPIFTRVSLHAFTGGIFSAAAGTTINFDGYQRQMIIAANSLVNESTNTIYTDFVRRSYSLKDYRNETFDENLPGSLLGLDSTGKLKLLTVHDFGNVVLKGINGEKLNLAQGKTAIVKLYLSAFNGPTPSSIQIWQYDASKGFWKQKGRVPVSATNEVIFELNELGYFALGSASDYVQITGRLVDKIGKPIPFIGSFLVSQPTEQHRSVWYYSNEQGYFKGYVKENSEQLLQVFGDCTPAIYSKQFTAANTNILLNNVVITDERVVSVKTNLKSCDGTNVSNGYLQLLGPQIRHQSNSEGMLEFNTIICNFTNPYRAFYVGEIPTAQISDMQAPAFSPGFNDLGNLSVCGTHYTVPLSCKLVDNAGKPIPDLIVRIIPLNDPSNYFRTKSNAEGLVSEFIYTNRNFQLSVYGSLQCNTALFTTVFSTSNKEVSLGNLTMSALTTAAISGSVVDCSNNPLPNGFVVVFKDEKAFQAPLSNTGTFSLTLPICNAGGTGTVLVTPVNSIDLLPGNTISTSIVSGTNTMLLSGCYSPSVAKEFVNYAIDNTLYQSYILPQDSILQQEGGYTGQMFIAVQRKTFYGSIWAFGFSIYTSGIAVGSNQPVEDLYFPEIDASASGPALAHITEYGPVGGYISGAIQTNVEDRNYKKYAVRISFRVKRNF